MTVFTFVAAIFDLTKSLPGKLPEAPVIKQINDIGSLLPFSDIGLGWVCPAAVGLAVGLVLKLIFGKRKKA